MDSLWNDADAMACGGDLLKLRVYTSRLLGREPALVLHGGGNTSVKSEVTDLFGRRERVLFVKGSGWDLATIEERGFAPVRLDLLERMADLPRLTDVAMVQAQRAGMTDASAPTPSVEAILHAIIPYTFVDHTHADAVVAITNTPDGPERIAALLGERVLVVPYVMPGFVLARAVRELTRDIDWSRYDGMVLLHHGVFTWGDDARTSYERMIRLVSRAEEYLVREGAWTAPAVSNACEQVSAHTQSLAALRRIVSHVRGAPMIARLSATPEACGFAGLPNVADVASRGTLTPDHTIRTKLVPVVLSRDPASHAADVAAYADSYRAYFARNDPGGLTCLDAAPRWAVWPEVGTVAFGGSVGDADIITDIARHTVRAIQWAEALGGWRALPEKDLFDVEYWELEQAKLRASGARRPLQGKIALVTGAASGIGRACVEMLAEQGAAVAALDINPAVATVFKASGVLGFVCDVMDRAQLRAAVEGTVAAFGGLDILVSNAGVFSPSRSLADMTDDIWQQSLALNLGSHQDLLQLATPYLKLGLDACVIINASKNVPAPGPGAGAYSVAKAGLTQLARVAALELAPFGVRVNVLHPHAVFDTGAWTPEVLAARASHYGISVDEYKRNNLLKVEVTSRDVGALVCAMAGPAFAKTTGAQVPIDGGSDRVI